MESWRSTPRVFWAVFSAPSFWLVAFFLIPLSLIWAYSFGEKTGIIDIAVTGTLDNYIRAFEPVYLQIFTKSLWIATLSTLICLAVGLPVALTIVYAPPKAKPWLLLLVILPFWTNLLIRTYALIAVLRTRGYVNFGLEWLYDQASWLFQIVGLGGLGAAILGERFEPVEILYNNGAVLIGLVYVHLPFMVLPLYAALERLDRSYLEASLDLGAGQFQTFWRVIVPLAMPGIVSGLIITFIPTLGSFLTPDLLGGPDSTMIANIIERQFKSANDWPFGSALSFMLMYLTFGALALRAFLGRGRSSGLEA
ncbi:MAG: ABC transporter permease [Alphaproteobacteria bacterium]|nr:ABC transporter permease [Alphaproteobacteria bacterium]